MLIRNDPLHKEKDDRSYHGFMRWRHRPVAAENLAIAFTTNLTDTIPLMRFIFLGMPRVETRGALFESF